MLKPTKHINFSQSILGFGSYILQNLNEPKSVDRLWDDFQVDLKNEKFHANHSFDNLILTLIFLYGIGTIKEKDGIIYKCV